MNSSQAKAVKPHEYILIFEFDGESGDRMSDELLSTLCRAEPNCLTKHWRGLLPGLTSGGTSPRRLINLVWLTLRSCFGILFGAKDRVVIVRSTPPLLHLPVALLCRWRSIRCIFWLMDYHPVIEQRLWSNRTWLRPLLLWLDSWDKRELASFFEVVVLDQAMADLVRSRNAASRVVVHPTWGAKLDHTALAATTLTGSTSLPDLAASGSAVIFAYLGNFGHGHGWRTLAACIRETARLRPVRLLCIGVPEKAESAFAALAQETGAELEKYPRMEFMQAVAVLRSRGASWGCVTMKSELVGCLSPSKFSGYLAAGVPLLYAGPIKTNAWQVCGEFDGGIALNDAAPPADIAHAAARLANDAERTRATIGAARAQRHFDSFDGATLAKLIASVGPN